jgi:NAD(P)-dependent dehydrogenase (short-subunit alcohol dehydrogenase family)
MAEEGRLDFFFANAGISVPKAKVQPGEDAQVAVIRNMAKGMDTTEAEEFNEVMRVNALR